ELNKKYESFSKSVKGMIGNVNKDLKAINDTLEKNIATIFTTRKNEIIKRIEQQSSGIVPLKKTTNVQITFEVLSPKNKKKKNTKTIIINRSYKKENQFSKYF